MATRKVRRAQTTIKLLSMSQRCPTPFRKIRQAIPAVMGSIPIAQPPVRAHTVKARIPSRKIAERMLPTFSFGEAEDLVVNPGDQAQPQKLAFLRVTPPIVFSVLKEPRTTLF